MSQRNGIRIWVAPVSTAKSWAWIETPPGGSPFSFLDQFHMIQAVCRCEILKYAGGVADRETWEKWTDFPRRFIDGCFDFEADYDSLRQRFGLRR